MGSEELIENAETAIGVGETGDYSLTLTTHAASLEAKAPALCKILHGSRLKTSASEFERKDLEARKAQSVFQKVAGKANWAVFVTSCLSAALLMAVAFDRKAQGLFVILGCCGIVSGALGTMWLFEVRQGNLFQTWMNRRARAEAERLNYFELATQDGEDSQGAGMPL